MYNNMEDLEEMMEMPCCKLQKQCLTSASKDAVRRTRHRCFHQSGPIIPRFALCLGRLINNLLGDNYLVWQRSDDPDLWRAALAADYQIRFP